MDMDFNIKIHCTCIYILANCDFNAFKPLISHEAAV
jgi:hypothetical protein